MNDRVFISYSNHDGAIANAICASIEAGGRTCWMAPRDIQPSTEWAEQIIDGINSANVMVLVFSGWSNKSPQVRREVERAVNREIPVIPFRIEKVLPVKSLEYFLSTQHWFDAFDGDMDAHVARLCGVVRTISTDRPHAVENGADHATETAPTATFAMPPRMPETPHYRDEDLAFVARELARQIGPIARFLVQRASIGSATPAAMVDTLAAEFKDPRERTAFLSACRQRLGF